VRAADNNPPLRRLGQKWQTRHAPLPQMTQEGQRIHRAVHICLPARARHEAALKKEAATRAAHKHEEPRDARLFVTSFGSSGAITARRPAVKAEADG